MLRGPSPPGRHAAKLFGLTLIPAIYRRAVHIEPARVWHTEELVTLEGMAFPLPGHVICLIRSD
jgi:hypothetical protein